MKLGFVTLLVAVVVIGLGVGGAFAGGVAVGQRQVEPTPAPSSSVQSLLERFQQGTPFPGMGQRGTVTAGQGTPLPEAIGREGLLGGLTGIGVVEKLEGNTITLTGGAGSTKVIVDKTTTISRSAEGVLGDIRAGDQVLVYGKRNDDGTISATSIIIVPAAQ